MLSISFELNNIQLVILQEYFYHLKKVKKPKILIQYN
jgi:hypothetical protein